MKQTKPTASIWSAPGNGQLTNSSPLNGITSTCCSAPGGQLRVKVRPCFRTNRLIQIATSPNVNTLLTYKIYIYNYIYILDYIRILTKWCWMTYLPVSTHLNSMSRTLHIAIGRAPQLKCCCCVVPSPRKVKWTLPGWEGNKLTRYNVPTSGLWIKTKPVPFVDEAKHPKVVYFEGCLKAFWMFTRVPGFDP